MTMTASHFIFYVADQERSTLFYRAALGETSGQARAFGNPVSVFAPLQPDAAHGAVVAHHEPAKDDRMAAATGAPQS
jgi:predicted enzyme related to lactoylglutathione lyase